MPNPDVRLNELCHSVIGAAFEVRKVLGRYLYEGIYIEALQIELKLRGIESVREFPIEMTYKGFKMHRKPLQVDLLVEGMLPLECKSISYMGRAEVSQIFKYLRFGGFGLGYLINFNADSFVATHLPKDYDCLTAGIYRVRL